MVFIVIVVFINIRLFWLFFLIFYGIRCCVGYFICVDILIF